MGDSSTQIRTDAPAPARTGTAAFADPAPDSALPRRLRLWPAVVIVVMLWVGLVVVIPILEGILEGMPLAVTRFVIPMLGSIGIAGWWLFASRVRWRDRFLGLLVCAAGGVVAWLLSDESISYHVVMQQALPVVVTAAVLWLMVSMPLSWPVRRAGLMIVLLLSWGSLACVRDAHGISGDFALKPPEWRWSSSAYRSAERVPVPMPMEAGKKLVLQDGDWPGFRGADRDSRLTGVTIRTDWQQHPPRLLWRHPVGPGWGSFAVIGDRLYTQEQSESDEAVVCYRASDGAFIWEYKYPAKHRDAESWEGPRATPTFHDGKIYAFGATGILTCLDAANGHVHWHHDVKADAGADMPQWGFAASPLISEGKVIIYSGEIDGKCLSAYDADTGKLAWQSGPSKLSHCSPQMAKLAGVDQILFATAGGLTSYQQQDGKLLWQFDWLEEMGPRIAQPAVIGDSDVLLGTGFGKGTKRLHITKNNDQWHAEKVWHTRAISSYFNDMVLHKGYLYGFDTRFFTCVNLETGQRKWREGGFGYGQVLLLADQDLLLIAGDDGKIALAEANPEAFKELGSFQSLEGKMWNHPVVAHGKLFIRNHKEAACYQLSE